MRVDRFLLRHTSEQTHDHYNLESSIPEQLFFAGSSAGQPPHPSPQSSAFGGSDFSKASLGAAKESFDFLAVFGSGVAIAASHRVDEAIDPFDEEGGILLARDRFASDGDENRAGVRPGRAVEDVSARLTASPQRHPTGLIHRNVSDQLLDDDPCLTVLR